MKKRICGHCKIEKDLEDFPRSKSRYLGRGYWCTVCRRQYDREHDKKPERKEASRQYQKSEQGRLTINKRLRLDYRQNKHKYTAKRLVEEKIRNGTMIKTPCIKCGDKRSLGHHPDYAKPLEVIWLCQKHHSEVHRELQTLSY